MRNIEMIANCYEQLQRLAVLLTSLRENLLIATPRVFRKHNTALKLIAPMMSAPETQL